MDQPEHYEQLSGGAAYARPESDDNEDGEATVRIVPISEGERTIGHRPDEGDTETAIWDPEPVKEAVEQGALDGSMIVKGKGGTNPHWPFDEQVPADSVLGRIDNWEYEDGVGPVGRAQLADDGIESRIDMGLLEVSGDWLRRLGEYDAERDGKPVSEVIGLPRVTVVERGAAAGASIDIEPGTAEALGYNPEAPSTDPDSEDNDEEDEDERPPPSHERERAQHAVSVGSAVRWGSPAGGEREPADERYGVVVDGLQDRSNDDVLVAVYQADENYESWENRDERNMMKRGNLEEVGPGGKQSLPPVSSVFDSEQDAQTVADPAESGRGADDNSTMGDQNPEKLREQLAESQDRVSSLENERDELDEQTDELESDLDETEEQLEEVKDERDTLEERVETLEEDFEPLKEAIAGLAAGDSKATAEQMAERFTGEELIEMLSDDEDDRTPTEQVQEQLAAGVEPRGESDEENTPGGTSGEEYTEEQLAEAEDLARQVMGGQDVMQAAEEQLSGREYVKRYKDVDPATVQSEAELRTKIDSQGGDA